MNLANNLDVSKKLATLAPCLPGRSHDYGYRLGKNTQPLTRSCQCSQATREDRYCFNLLDMGAIYYAAIDTAINSG